MPKQVRGQDGRIIQKQLSDGDADTVARQVHANTGEVVTLVPFIDKGEDGYVLDEDAATTVGAPPVEETAVELPEVVGDDEIESLTKDQIHALAKREGFELDDAKKPELVADLIAARKHAREHQ